jgi:hypothetical protein
MKQEPGFLIGFGDQKSIHFCLPGTLAFLHLHFVRKQSIPSRIRPRYGLAMNEIASSRVGKNRLKVFFSPGRLNIWADLLNFTQTLTLHFPIEAIHSRGVISPSRGSLFLHMPSFMAGPAVTMIPPKKSTPDMPKH